MVDFAIDCWKKVNPDQEVPQHFTEKRSKVVTRLRELEKLTEPILALIMKEEISQEIAKTRDARQLLEYLQKNHGVRIFTYCQQALRFTNNTSLFFASLSIVYRRYG